MNEIASYVYKTFTLLYKEGELLSEIVNVIHQDPNEIPEGPKATVDSIIHEWRESAAAIRSNSHRQAYQGKEEGTKVELTAPDGFKVIP